MGTELLTDLTDYTYNGHTLRNDKNFIWRNVQRGDSYSFHDISDWGIQSFSMVTLYGVLCPDLKEKSALAWLRDKIYNTDTANQVALPDMYLNAALKQGTPPVQSIENITPKFLFDNANDIVTIRTNYSYVNDTIIEIDGGEERGGGHSQAQGYYLYALGEPFLDYTQVPYEDDVRSEAWKNGVSLINDVQTVEGQSGFYSSTCGNAWLNQYYGMGDCPMTGSYPDFRKFPLQYVVMWRIMWELLMHASRARMCGGRIRMRIRCGSTLSSLVTYSRHEQP